MRIFRTLTFAANYIFLMTALTAAEDRPSGVVIPLHEVMICPFEDCYLTFVDETLCYFLDEVFDPHKAEFTDKFNCIYQDEGIFLCLNVLMERRYDEQRQSYYTDPYIFELMSSFHKQLNVCLSSWSRSFDLTDTEQSLMYSSDRGALALKISQFEDMNVQYDQLMLRLSITP